ncbi:hypothetical protein FRC07_014804 [Ceratobasidium sp. 392]|nr:hypothetical protein FRC07_014804 [Ceratobasidium sp. 392]
MAPQDPLLTHLISRLEADINFLSNNGHITSPDAQTVLGILSRAGSNSNTNPPSVNTITSGLRDISMASTGMPAPYGGSTPSPAPAPISYPSSPAYGNNANNNANTAPPAFPGGPPVGAPSYGGSMTPSPALSALKRPVPPPPAPGGVQAKALWDYNIDGQLKDDLTFRSGDIIQIVKEENADWWTGRLNGKEGMFPSNHVEKLPNTPSYGPSAPSYNPSYGSQPSYGYNEKDQHQQHQMYTPPPGPPANYQQAGPVQQQPPTEEEKKKGKFGKYGGMMAGSAAGGLGFGAGAAVGSGLINAIF